MPLPRASREIAESGIYHVIVRGNGKQLLFEDDSDRAKFLTLIACKGKSFKIGILGWCLMSNHVHLLLDDPSQALSGFMHALSTAYAAHFNKKAGHSGSVFQGRFTSIPVRDDAQLLQALRYIHLNPQKAGICPFDAYPWSSYRAYAEETDSIADTTMILDLCSRNEIRRFHAQDDAPYYPLTCHRPSDEDALDAARSIMHPIAPADIKGLPKPQRNKMLKRLRQAKLTVKQIQRITGIGASTITRATSE